MNKRRRRLWGIFASLLFVGVIVLIGAGVSIWSIRETGEVVLRELTSGLVADAGYVHLYAKTDGRVYSQDDAGTEYDLTSPASAHNLLSATHADTAEGGPTRGDIITAQGVTPLWTVLNLGSSGQYLRSNGTDIIWASIFDGDLPASITRDTEWATQALVEALWGTTLATDAELSTHASATSTHGVTGNVVGTTDTQTLTDKTLTSPTIQGTVGAGTGLTLPAFIAGGAINLNNQDFSNAFEAFASFLYNNPLKTVNFQASYSFSGVGSGTHSTSPSNTAVNTGTTANSSMRVWTNLVGFRRTSDGMDWGKKLWFFFVIGRSGTDTEASSWVQLREDAILGDLNHKGIGFLTDNFVAKGESYGTQQCEVDLTLTLSDSNYYQVAILLDPANTQVKWYVNGAEEGTQSTAACIPSGTSSQGTFLLQTQNGASGGSNVWSRIGEIWFWQEQGG